jgi:nucleoside-diphosphate-sugar epimerase
MVGARVSSCRRAAQRLAEQREVRLLVRSDNEAAHLQAKGFDVVVGDVTNPAMLQAAVDGVDAVVHLAAFFRGATPEQMEIVNHQGTVHLARAGLAARVTRFVFASTSLVYASGLNRPACESDPVQPAWPYPASKLAAEQSLLGMQRDDGLDVRVLRLAFVYGDGDPHLRDWLPRLRDRPSALMQLVHHADVGQAIDLALRDNAGGIYNVADEEVLRVHQIRGLLGEPFHAEDEIVHTSPEWTGVMDTARIRTELGFRPVFGSLRDAAARNAL